MNIDDVHAYLFSGEPHPREPQLKSWLRISRRFTAFVENTKSKIRKKLRAAQDPESAADLRLELETAYLLVQERRFSLDYEPLVPGRPRRPDFAVNYTTHHMLMLEVTRLRLRTELKPERLIDTVCNKLGQLSPGRNNVLLIGSPLPITPPELHAVMTELQRRAERGDASLLKRFQDRRDFFTCYQRLSEILVRTPSRDNFPATWVNPQAKRLLPSRVRTALYRSQTVQLLPQAERCEDKGKLVVFAS